VIFTFTWLIRGLLGLVGIVQPIVTFKPSNYAEFRKRLKPGSLVCIRPVEPDGTSPTGLSNGIQAGSGSAWSHVENYFGASSGERGIQGETVGALAEGVKIHSLDEYGNNGFQMVAFNFDLDSRTFSILKNRIYSKVGEPYDTWKIVKFAVPFFPDLGNLIVCSTLAAFARNGCSHWNWRCLFNVLPKRVLPENATPGDIFAGCYPQTKIEVLKFNW
jgi:hypothetical protein